MSDMNAIADLRRRALTGQDALRFFELTSEGGFDCESLAEEVLFERGMLESRMQEVAEIDEVSSLQVRRRNVSNETYSQFLQEAGQYSQNIGLSIDAKRRILAQYFPGRFGDEGRTPIYGLDGLQVGAVFEKLRKYAKRRLAR